MITSALNPKDLFKSRRRYTSASGAPRPSIGWARSLRTVPPSFETKTALLAKTGPTAAAPAVNLTSDREDTEDVDDSSHSSKRTRHFDNPLGSNHLPRALSGPSTSHSALATVSASPPIEVE